MVHDTRPAGRDAKGFRGRRPAIGRQGRCFRPSSRGPGPGVVTRPAFREDPDVTGPGAYAAPLASAPADAWAITAGTSIAVARCKSFASPGLPTTANTVGPHELCPTPLTPSRGAGPPGRPRPGSRIARPELARTHLPRGR